MKRNMFGSPTWNMTGRRFVARRRTRTAWCLYRLPSSSTSSQNPNTNTEINVGQLTNLEHDRQEIRSKEQDKDCLVPARRSEPREQGVHCWWEGGVRLQGGKARHCQSFLSFTLSLCEAASRSHSLKLDIVTLEASECHSLKLLGVVDMSLLKLQVVPL